jgi:tousled-like kinase
LLENNKEKQNLLKKKKFNVPISPESLVNTNVSHQTITERSCASGFIQPLPIVDVFEELEALKFREHILKAEENEIKNKLEKLSQERDLLFRKQRDLSNRQNSRFNNFNIIGPGSSQKYLLLSMLGKGGFSEVYKAFNLDTLEYVACKIFTLVTKYCYLFSAKSGRKRRRKVTKNIRQGNI